MNHVTARNGGEIFLDCRITCYPLYCSLILHSRQTALKVKCSWTGGVNRLSPLTVVNSSHWPFSRNGKVHDATKGAMSVNVMPWIRGHNSAGEEWHVMEQLHSITFIVVNANVYDQQW